MNKGHFLNRVWMFVTLQLRALPLPKKGPDLIVEPLSSQ